jgi:hypothetical protein
MWRVLKVTPRPFYPLEKRPGPRAGLNGCGKKLTLTGIRSPKCPAHPSLYRLSYSGSPPSHFRLAKWCRCKTVWVIRHCMLNHKFTDSLPDEGRFLHHNCSECNKLCRICFPCVVGDLLPRWIQRTDLTHILQARPDSFGEVERNSYSSLPRTQRRKFPPPPKPWGSWHNSTGWLVSVHGLLIWLQGWAVLWCFVATDSIYIVWVRVFALGRLKLIYVI